jgi:hypothetical protein
MAALSPAQADEASLWLAVFLVVLLALSLAAVIVSRRSLAVVLDRAMATTVSLTGRSVAGRRAPLSPRARRRRCQDWPGQPAGTLTAVPRSAAEPAGAARR